MNGRAEIADRIPNRRHSKKEDTQKNRQGECPWKVDKGKRHRIPQNRQRVKGIRIVEWTDGYFQGQGHLVQKVAEP